MMAAAQLLRFVCVAVVAAAAGTTSMLFATSAFDQGVTHVLETVTQLFPECV